MANEGLIGWSTGAGSPMVAILKSFDGNQATPGNGTLISLTSLAHAAHPITAVQSECSLWTRDPEPLVLPACPEPGVVGLVPFMPVDRAMLSSRL